MKRTMSSDMDSDCDDLFDDNSSKGTPTPSSDSCQMVNRKRRRGIIEKRRRDRINHSLSELRRLVPAAFEKQGSAKLEKAEILQMTVDHLKMLHAKGFDALTFDPHKFAMDYHSIGFRECASEVARYMVAIEGLDLQDPLRLRLMSHLQCYSTQRELALKSSLHTPWSSSTPPVVPPPVPPPPNPVQPVHQYPTHNPDMSSASAYNCSDSRLGHYGDPLGASVNNSNFKPMHSPGMGHGPPPSSAFGHSLGGPTQMMPSIGQMPGGNQYLTGHGFASTGYPSNGTGQSSSVKPYRPWGAELAY